MKKTLVGIIVCIVLVAAVASVAQAAPSFRGYTGLVLIPNADSLNKGDYNFGAMTEDTGKFEANDLFANYSPTDGLEVGFNSFQVIGTDERETLLNGKYTFMPETEDKAGIAFGITDLTNEVQSTAYAVLSKSIVRGLNVFDSEITNIRGHVGFGGGRFDGMFLGLSGFVGNRIMISVEYDSKDTNIGFRFTPIKLVRLHAALIDVDGSSNLGVGISFNKSL
ncbi:MAG: hypothetical protein A2Z18_01935 [Armatimonadetes bacterium RBG_16_58_9]|nr:MAG: hypothetical protein A2Z18_01935 [Armatimonadetes bacterium RBG_16_58_9]